MGIILSIINYRSRCKKVMNYVKTNKSFDELNKFISPISRHGIRQTKSFDNILYIKSDINLDRGFLPKNAVKYEKSIG